MKNKNQHNWIMLQPKKRKKEIQINSVIGNGGKGKLLESEHFVSEENSEEISSSRLFDDEIQSNCLGLLEDPNCLNFSMVMISLPHLYSLAIV